MTKKSFYMHIDMLDVLDDLDDEQTAMLFRAIRDYQNGKEVTLTGLMMAVFRPFKNRMDADSERYKEACARNKANGSKGGRPAAKKPKITQNNPVGFSETNPNPKNPDTDTDTDTDTDILKNIIKKPKNVSHQIWNDFLSHRKAKRAKLTQTALTLIENQAILAGWKLEDALAECCARGWVSFKADWVNKSESKEQEMHKEISKGTQNVTRKPGNRGYTAEDARREVLAEYGIQDFSDNSDGGAVFCHSGHLRKDAEPVEDFDESDGGGFITVQR